MTIEKKCTYLTAEEELALKSQIRKGDLTQAWIDQS